MTSLTLSFLQHDLQWEAPQHNRDSFGTRIAALPETQLIVLPEMFTTGFSMDSSALAEPMAGPTVDWMQQQSAQTGSTLCGSVIIEESGNYYNRLLWVTPDGDVQSYDKKHLFRMSTENDNYTPGIDRKIFNINGINILPQVCYDLRFPVFSRNQGDVDMMLFVANWPAARAMHWRTLLRARAIENQCYVLGVNRVGVDGNGVSYCGDSQFIDPAGALLADLGARSAATTVTFDLDALRAYRQAFPAWKDADTFALISEQDKPA